MLVLTRVIVTSFQDSGVPGPFMEVQRFSKKKKKKRGLRFTLSVAANIQPSYALTYWLPGTVPVVTSAHAELSMVATSQ